MTGAICRDCGGAMGDGPCRRCRPTPPAPCRPCPPPVYGFTPDGRFIEVRVGDSGIPPGTKLHELVNGRLGLFEIMPGCPC